MEKLQLTAASLMRTGSLLNLPQKAVVFATMAGPSEITWLTAQNKAASGIEFEDFILDDEPEAMVARPAAPQKTQVGMTAARAASPHYSLAQMENLMRAELQKPAAIDKIVAKANLDPLSSTIFREHIEKLYRNDLLIRRISQELVRAQSSMSGDNAFEMAKEIGKETSSKLTVLGLRRLSDEDVKRYFYYITLIAANSKPAQCKAIFSDDGASDATAEYKAVRLSGGAALSHFLSLNRRSIFAELADAPSIATVSANQKNLAEKAYEKLLYEALIKLPQHDMERISAALQDMEHASDVDTCDAFYVMFKAMHDMAGMPGAWYRREFVRSMTE